MMDVPAVIKAPALGEVVHMTPDFAVRIDSIVDPESNADLIVYGVVNKATGVREAELRGFIPAKQWANQMQAAHNKELDNDALERELESAFVGEEEAQYEIPKVRSAEELNAALNGDD